MEQTILTANQQALLSLLAKESVIFKNFYLSGGTALAEYYLHHRYSEDLDFFSNEEVEPITIQTILKKIQKEMPIESVDFQQSFNRNLFFVHLKDDVIKTEFTYYPFTQIEQPQTSHNLKVDSLIDIAVNKTFTIYQRPRSRDFIDLYVILKQNSLWNFRDLMRKARAKFDSPLDPIQTAQQLLLVNELKDYPKMIVDLKPEIWQSFWVNQAKELKNEALT